MCQYSATAENQRDARQGEDLVVSKAPHGYSNWLTSPGEPECAICVPDSAFLAVQVPMGAVRGAHFSQRKQCDNGHFDFLNFLDGKQESVPLDEFPVGTGVRVLQLASDGRKTAYQIPTAITSTEHGFTVEEDDDDGDLVPVGVAHGSDRARRGIRTPSFLRH